MSSRYESALAFSVLVAIVTKAPRLTWPGSGDAHGRGCKLNVDQSAVSKVSHV